MSTTQKGHLFTVTLSISASQFEQLYRGQVKTVLARDRQGKTVQFPAVSLRSFLTHNGIQGTFDIRVDDGNRLVDIQRRE